MKTVRYGIRMDERLLLAYEKEASKRKTTACQLIRKALSEYLEVPYKEMIRNGSYVVKPISSK